jgi:hypothetical protein
MPIPVSGESPAWGTGLGCGGSGGGGGAGLTRGGGGGGGTLILGGGGGGGGAGAVVLVVAVDVVVVTRSGVLPMVSTQRKSEPQAGSSRARPRSRVTTRSRPGLTPPNPCHLPLTPYIQHERR